jgi:glycerol transport system substrate-binding protein
MRNLLLNTTACAAIMLATGSAHADMAAAEKFLAEEIGGLSVLSEDEQKAEMEFFINAAKPFAGMEIKVVSETIAPRTNTSPRCWHPPSPRSPASRSPMT